MDAGKSPSNDRSAMLKAIRSSVSRTGMSMRSGFAEVAIANSLQIEVVSLRGAAMFLPLASLHRVDHLVGAQHRMGQVRIVDERRRVAVTPRRMLRRGGGVFDHRDLEPLLDQFAQV